MSSSVGSRAIVLLAPHVNRAALDNATRAGMERRI